MKNRNKKLLIRGVADGSTVLLDSSKFYVLFILAVCRVLYEEFGFSTERLNRVTAGLEAFLDREDPATIGDELMYWADKKGINIKGDIRCCIAVNICSSVSRMN